MGNVIFAYRLVADTGFAPCIDNGLLTLACCKGGQIRNGKDVKTGLRHTIGKHLIKYPYDNVDILGIYKNKLLYYAKVTEIIKMTDYFSKKVKAEYGKRKDHIYNTVNGVLIRNNFIPYMHPKGDLQNRRDANGVYVLTSRQFTYFGDTAPLIPNDVLEVLPAFRENPPHYKNSTSFKIISNYIKKNISFDGVVGKPHKQLEITKGGGC